MKEEDEIIAQENTYIDEIADDSMLNDDARKKAQLETTQLEGEIDLVRKELQALRILQAEREKQQKHKEEQEQQHKEEQEQQHKEEQEQELKHQEEQEQEQHHKEEQVQQHKEEQEQKLKQQEQKLKHKEEQEQKQKQKHKEEQEQEQQHKEEQVQQHKEEEEQKHKHKEEQKQKHKEARLETERLKKVAKENRALGEGITRLRLTKPGDIREVEPESVVECGTINGTDVGKHSKKHFSLSPPPTSQRSSSRSSSPIHSRDWVHYASPEHPVAVANIPLNGVKQFVPRIHALTTPTPAVPLSFAINTATIVAKTYSQGPINTGVNRPSPLTSKDFPKWNGALESRREHEFPSHAQGLTAASLMARLPAPAAKTRRPV